MQPFIISEPSRVWQRDRIRRTLQATPGWTRLVLCFVLLSGSCPAQSNSVLKLEHVVGIKSIFIDDPKLGKDPFFPKSGRRMVQPTVPVGTTPDVVVSAQNL